MQELRLVAVSEDGTYLVLATAGRGTRFTLPVDDRLRAAVRGHFSRLGQFEIEVESPLRPKEIQARIRAGETAEEIAESAGIPVERVRWFEGPVLQEREYMAQQAQRVTIRRPGESSPGPPLGELVEERLGRGGVDLEEVEWDAWKCEDSTWRVRLSFFDEGRPHAAEWMFDPRRRHLSPLDEVAARLSSLDWREPAGDTVTPLLPRRPAMKVVSDAREIPAPRTEPDPTGRPGEPRREYIVERGRIVDPRPQPLGRPARPVGPPSREETARLAERAASVVRPTEPPREIRPEPAAVTVPRPAPAEPPAAPPAPVVARPLPPAAAPEAVKESTPAPEPAEGVAARPALERDERPGTSAGETVRTADDAADDSVDYSVDEAPGAADPHADDPVEDVAEGSAETEPPAAQRPEPDDSVAAEEHEAGPAEQGSADPEPPAPEPLAPEPPAAAAPPAEPAAAKPASPPAEPEPELPAEPAAEDPAADAPAATTPPKTPAAPAAENEEEGPVAQAPPVEVPTPAPAEQPAPPRPATAPETRRRPAKPKSKPVPRPRQPAADPGGETEAAETVAPPRQPAARGNRRKAKSKRASVPSWDEIMFGARRPD
ncbi:septation protein SepH [Actinomadura craniellae]|uniref:septation protein SepH n=1 Tax=Actinomadura craniellae TaxID=2231787 RepID=UPI001EEDC3BE|nr:septation protein SepH [Actinomadura craniellae]